MPDEQSHRTQGPSWSRPMTETRLDPDPPEEPRPVQGEDMTRAAVARLSRPHRSGGSVIERAAILADGADSTRYGMMKNSLTQDVRFSYSAIEEGSKLSNKL